MDRMHFFTYFGFRRKKTLARIVEWIFKLFNAYNSFSRTFVFCINRIDMSFSFIWDICYTLTPRISHTLSHNKLQDLNTICLSIQTAEISNLILISQLVRTFKTFIQYNLWGFPKQRCLLIYIPALILQKLFHNEHFNSFFLRYFVTYFRE